MPILVLGASIQHVFDWLVTKLKVFTEYMAFFSLINCLNCGRHGCRFRIMFSFFFLKIAIGFGRVLSYSCMKIPGPCNMDVAFDRLINECAVSEFYPSQGNFKIDVTLASSNLHTLLEASLLPSIWISGLPRLKTLNLFKFIIYYIPT